MAPGPVGTVWSTEVILSTPPPPLTPPPFFFTFSAAPRKNKPLFFFRRAWLICSFSAGFLTRNLEASRPRGPGGQPDPGLQAPGPRGGECQEAGSSGPAASPGLSRSEALQPRPVLLGARRGPGAHREETDMSSGIFRPKSSERGGE